MQVWNRILDPGFLLKSINFKSLTQKWEPVVTLYKALLLQVSFTLLVFTSTEMEPKLIRRKLRDEVPWCFQRKETLSTYLGSSPGPFEWAWIVISPFFGVKWLFSSYPWPFCLMDTQIILCSVCCRCRKMTFNLWAVDISPQSHLSHAVGCL